MMTVGILCLSSCANQTPSKILISNPSSKDRSSETVILSAESMELEATNDLGEYGLKDEKGEWMITQYVDKDGDGIVDGLLFQPSVPAHSEAVFSMEKFTRDSETIDSEVVCFSRFVPERTDDYAWENDRVAFRVFGPKAQIMAENGVNGGTLSSGIDCWLKKVDYPIIDKWYGKNTAGTGSYHEDTGEGLDNFHVGKSRGCGGLAVKENGQFYTSKNFIDWNPKTVGPLRTSFFLDYVDWKAGDNTIKESINVTLDKGNNLSKFDVQIEGTDTLWVGITLHEGDGKVSVDSLKGSVSYWQPHGNSELGMGIVAAPGTYIGAELVESEEQDVSHLYIKLAVKDNQVSYYTGFSWKESSRITTEQAWNDYLATYAENIKNPLIVSIQ